MFTNFYDRSRRFCTWNDPQHFDGVLTAQFPFEIEALAMIYQKTARRKVLEIGSQNGGTLRYWLSYANDDTQIIAVDPDPGFTFSDPRLTVFPSRSDDPGTLAAIQAIAPFDFIFIDGDHSYNGARYDWDTYGPLVGPGGVIAFHDIITNRPDCQVRYLWEEIQAAGYITQELLVSASCAPLGAGIGVVYIL
jgi:predicted O-methyltransferase YrrM